MLIVQSDWSYNPLFVVLDYYVDIIGKHDAISASF